MASEEPPREDKSLPTVSKDCRPTAPDSCNMHSQATAFARLAESPSLKDGSTNISTKLEKLNTESGLLTILPVSAESTGLLPKRQDPWKEDIPMTSARGICQRAGQVLVIQENS
ncbi:hypothetical protein HS088_TW10G00865 [Tripterygium wilfordii]|uniref:Uncharacterized protein n=1 Tax=Tripterygium wilfordii TaxID=458696 RepID=A0A7J7D6C3_TRIWF|nr:hypothetical protein HS088_TW10G00865 [Tripterygium wilfordii]